MVGTRSSSRILEHFQARTLQGSQVLIYGVGKHGVHALNELIQNPRLGIKPLGFVDEDPWNQGKRVNGYPVLGNPASLEALLQENSVAEVILSQDDISLENLHRLFDICHFFKIPLRRFQTRLEEITLDSPVAGSKAQSQRIEAIGDKL